MPPQHLFDQAAQPRSVTAKVVSSLKNNVTRTHNDLQLLKAVVGANKKNTQTVRQASMARVKKASRKMFKISRNLLKNIQLKKVIIA